MTETIVSKLIDDIFNDEYFQRLYKTVSLNHGKLEICQAQSEGLLLTPKEFFDLSRFADILSCSEDYRARNRAFRIISHLFPFYKNNYDYQRLAKAILLKLGNFPSIELLQKNEKRFIDLPFERLLERSFKEDIQETPHKEGSYFTDAQFQLFGAISGSKCFSFSGPTSVGKSFIIRAFLRKVLENKPPENIVLMVPTRALINQFSIDIKNDLKNVLDLYNYRISTNSNIVDYIENKDTQYIFILTPERLLSYLSRTNNPSLGFLFVDEAHKLTIKDDYRSVVIYNAIEKVLRRHPDINLYFSSPNVANPDMFLKVFKTGTNNLDFKKSGFTEESPVTQNRFFIDLSKNEIWQYIEDIPELIRRDDFGSIKNCTDLILSIGKDKCNIVYCNTKNNTLEYAIKACEKIPSTQGLLSKNVDKAIRQIKSYIHEEFYLAKFLEKSVAYHYGNLPQIIRNIVEKLYRDGDIKYLFCTSTLLEGVNLPAKNVFIIKKGYGRKQNLLPIDFKNLAGRAGRLGYELSGNVICVSHEDNDWDKSDICVDKEKITLELTVRSRIDHNLNKITKILENQDISGSETEKQILKYIANIICLDTMSVQADYQSPVITQLVEKKKEIIIEHARKKIEKIDTPIELLEAGSSIDLELQDVLYKDLRMHAEKLPATIDYPISLQWLKKLFVIYKWDKTEPKLKHENSLKYYATLTNMWINGTPLNLIIKNGIDFYDEEKREIQTGWKNNAPVRVKFDKTDPFHINVLANHIIEDIEHILRFLFEKYFDHYYRNLVNILGEEQAGPNWALYLEYGTKDTTNIALQNLGLSRHTATKIRRDYSSCLNIIDGKLHSIDREKLIMQFDRDSLEYDEISTFL